MGKILGITLGDLWEVLVKSLLAVSMSVVVVLLGLGTLGFLGTLFFGGELHSAIENLKGAWIILPEALAVAGWVYIYYNRYIKA